MRICEQVKDRKGEKQWKRIEVKLEEHVNIPIFPTDLSPTSYDEYLEEYISKIGSSFHKTNHYGKFTLLNIQQAMQLVLSYFRKHGRGWEGASPESDAAQHEMQRPMWLPTRWCRI